MKSLFVIYICSIALAVGAWAQSPAPSPGVAGGSPAAGAPATAASPSATASDLASKVERDVHKKLKQKGLHFTIGDDEDSESSSKSDKSNGDIPEFVIPIVAIVFMTIFGAPVLIVAVIMYFGFSKNRMMHRTVRMMVEKGQEVPAALLAPPPPAIRQRSDMRRGVVLTMVGIGLMVFLGAANDWENGAWALGIIPFLIGVGYLLVWKLEGGKKDIPPPLPLP